jgi:hypothetical protein
MLLRDVVAALGEIRNDLSYTQNLEARWEKEADRFPLIFEYIKKQSEFFKEEIEKLFLLNVDDNTISEFVKTRRAQAEQVPKLEGTATQAAEEVAQKRAEDKSSEEAPPALLASQKEPQDSAPVSPDAAVPSPSPPLAAKEKSSAEKRSEKKSENRKPAPRAKLRKHADKV